MAIAATGVVASAGTVRTPVRVGVTVTRPCEIIPPVSISLDASGNPVLGRGTPAVDCGVDPTVTVSVDTSIAKGGYVVSIVF